MAAIDDLEEELYEAVLDGIPQIGLIYQERRRALELAWPVIVRAFEQASDADEP